jgi:hypothetical protein
MSDSKAQIEEQYTAVYTGSLILAPSLNLTTNTFLIFNKAVNQKPLKSYDLKGFLLDWIAFVGMAGFEPAASTSQMWRDTGLRYIPFILQLKLILHCLNQKRKPSKFKF